MKEYLNVFKKYADFNGRARRREYWMFILFHMIFVYGLMFLGALIGPLVFILVFVYMVVAIVPTIAVTVRRMHDTGNQGVYMLIPVYSFILAVTEGEKGVNQYGPDPKTEQMNSNNDLLDDGMTLD